ncbi:YlcI/YnfO family protein [Endozoicomonas ascidiicola]|uniref:YlcI/YnfO family protein n=1 Tax=Endozoicomonas ascidiicola TaxID=1698521 RepID=UPI0012FC7AF2|nr:YlcI/YnfO family protein [Endozoicomonas ascidiicola]
MRKEQHQKVHIRLPASIKNDIAQFAELEERSINSWVVLAIKEKLKRAKTKQKAN